MAIDVLVGTELVVANAKSFKTGSDGYFGTGKVEVDGVRYQCQVQLVRIGSKPVTPETLAAKAKAKEDRAKAAYDKAREARLAVVAGMKAKADAGTAAGREAFDKLA